MYWFLHTYHSQKRFFYLFRMGAKIFVSHNFHVRNKYLCTHPKPSSAFRMVRLWVLIFISCVFYPKYFYYYLLLSLNRRGAIVHSCPFIIMATMAPPPPCPNLGYKVMSSGGVAAKMVSPDSWGQCVSYRIIKTIKARCNSIKNSPFVFVRAEPLHIEW